MKKWMLLALTASLAACGGSKDDANGDYDKEIERRNQNLVFAYPAAGQHNVPVTAPLMLSFSSAVKQPNALSLQLVAAGQPPVALQVEAVDQGRGLLLTPAAALQPLTAYKLALPAIDLEKGTAPARTLDFNTAPRWDTALAGQQGDRFAVVNQWPALDQPVPDLASLRLQLSQPLDPASVRYGNQQDSTVALLDANDQLVAADVLAVGPYLTVDPQADLPAGSYQLLLGAGLLSTAGNSLPGSAGSAQTRYRFTVIDTRPPQASDNPQRERAMMRQSLVNGGTSALTGAAVNQVPLSSVLLGAEAEVALDGDLIVELAHAPAFPAATPLRLPRGTVLNASNLDVQLGGEVAAGLSSGRVTLELLSDATGVLLDNPYSRAADAPKLVRAMMDVAISAEDPRANGAVTQTLMHVALVGTARARGDDLVLDVIAVAEPQLLSSEYARTLISLHLEGKPTSGVRPPVDDRVLEQVHAGAEADPARVNPHAPLTLMFNKAIALQDAEQLSLTHNGVPVPFSAAVRGSALYLQPQQPLSYAQQQGDQVQPSLYELSLGAGIVGLNGAAVAGNSGMRLEMPVQVSEGHEYGWRIEDSSSGEMPQFIDLGVQPVPQRAPMLLVTYPGQPCALDPASLDLANSSVGYCAGSLREPYRRKKVSNLGLTVVAELSKLPEPDLPLSTLPANRPLITIFSKPIAASSVQLGGSYQVEQIDESGRSLGAVAGRVEVNGAELRFWPQQLWKEGALYRYRLASNGDRHSASAQCDGQGAICDVSGLPIQTQLHALERTQAPIESDNEIVGYDDMIVQSVNLATGGGPDLVQYFRAEASSTRVLQVLNGPSVDTNANLRHERNVPSLIPAEMDQMRISYMEYSVEEDGVDSSQLDPTACAGAGPCLDPGGIAPIRNSAKILSTTLYEPGDNMSMPGLNIGCGYLNGQIRDDQQNVIAGYDRAECPESLFMHLTASLVAEVGDYDAALGGLEVVVHPAQIFGTSVPIYAAFPPLGGEKGVLGMDSGPQVMRLRPAIDDLSCVDDIASGKQCSRSQPIRGVIREQDGQAVLDLTVDIYADAMELQTHITAIATAMGVEGFGDVLHDLVQVPLQLQLTGPVSFNADGTMKVAQQSVNALELPLNLVLNTFGSYFLMADYGLLIPSGGAKLELHTQLPRP